MCRGAVCRKIEQVERRNSMRIACLLLIIAFVVALTGCTMEEESALAGGAIGAGAGAIIGNQSDHAAEGALIGATAGLLGGYLFGKHKAKKTTANEVEKYVECPKCKSNLQLPPDATAGNKIQCGNCEAQFVLQ
jgi:osmotically inducible lipoprotein OsmB